MAKAGSTKKTKKIVSPTAEMAEPVVQPSQPRLRDYVRAVGGMIGGWIKRHKLIVACLFIVLLAGIAVLVNAAWRDNQVLTNDEIVVRVSRELGISDDANPAILEVTDEQKVSQPFLEGAQNGDKVLLYYKAAKSALFRPSQNLVVRTGTYRAPDAKVFIRKGTLEDAKVVTARDKVAALSGLTIASQDTSTNQNQTTTVVVDVTDRYNQKAQEVAKALGASLVRLPRGESVPDADILVIVGAN